MSKKKTTPGATGLSSPPHPQDADRSKTLADLFPLIEHFNTEVEHGRFQEAARMLFDQLVPYPLYFKFGAYAKCIELLTKLISPDGSSGSLTDPALVGRARNDLSQAYAMIGDLQKASVLLNRNLTTENSPLRVATTLLNLASSIFLPTGDLASAVKSIEQSIDVLRQHTDRWVEAVAHFSLGHTYIYTGAAARAEQELNTALMMFENLQAVRYQGMVWASRALHALSLECNGRALAAARHARSLADVRSYEKDIVIAERLLGAACLAQMRKSTAREKYYAL